MAFPSISDHRRRRRARTAAVVLAGILLVWALAATAVRVIQIGQVMPGTTMAGVPLGGLSAEEAGRALSQARLAERTAVLTHGKRRFPVTGGAVGLRLDVERSTERATSAGRQGVLDFLAGPVIVLGLERQVRPAYLLNSAAVDREVARIAAQVDRPRFRGEIVVDAQTLAVGVRAPRRGLRVQRAATARATTDALRTHGRPRPLPVATTGVPSIGSLRRVAADAHDYLAGGPMWLTGAGARIALGPESLARVLGVEHPPRGAPRLGVRVPALRRVVAAIGRRRDRRAVDAQVAAAPAPVTLETKGDLAWRQRSGDVQIRKARRGRAIKRRQAERVIARAVRTGEHQVPLPVASVAPRLQTAQARKIRKVIGTFTTRFACCEPRATNIRLIARAVDGTIVLPGEQFSLNRSAGPRTKRRGFRPAPFIADGKIVPSVGGGVSQFSTTLYNAAYFAGLRLDAHQPHSFYIDRYPAGREATLDYDSIDLKWTNDTEAPVLLRASSTDTSVTVTLYGENHGRRVRAESGRRRPVADRDFQVTVTRVIRYRDGREVRQAYTTTYDEPPPPEDEEEKATDAE